MSLPVYFEPKLGTVLNVSGEDAAAFLQGQFSNNLKSNVLNACTYGLWLNSKGKPLGDSWVLASPTAPFLIISERLASVALQERLNAYIVADDVTLEDATAQWRSFGWWGEGSKEIAAACFGGVPKEGEWAGDGEARCFASHRARVRSFEAIMRRGTAPEEKLISALRKTSREITAIEAERERILAGIPAVPQDIGPGDLPQEGGLEKTAISFNKGCYLGQEVMARIDSMGQVRRTLVRVRGFGEKPPLPCEIFENGKRIGELRSAVPTESGDDFDGLALISRTSANTGTKFALSPNSAPSLEEAPAEQL